jgi:hypothetical protein
MNPMRRPLLIVGAVLILVAFGIEAASRLWIADAIGVPANTPRPGLGIPSLAAVDALLLLTVTIMALGALAIWPSLLARLNGIVSVIVAFLTLLASLGLVFVAFGLVMLMVGLFLAPPFGTAVYVAVFGHFNRGDASVTLALLMLLKVIAAICVVLGSPYALKSLLFVLMFTSSILLTFLLSFLHGLPPGVLVSITDGVGAIIAFVVAIIWAIIYLVGGIVALLGNLQIHARASEER